MRISGTWMAMAAMLSIGGVAQACQGPFPLVAVHYLVHEQVPERVETAITNPLERVLARLPRLAGMNSVTGHGAVSVELRFDGGATGRDLAIVSEKVGELDLGGAGGVVSTKVFLTSSCLSTWPWTEAGVSGAPREGQAAARRRPG